MTFLAFMISAIGLKTTTMHTLSYLSLAKSPYYYRGSTKHANLRHYSHISVISFGLRASNVFPKTKFQIVTIRTTGPLYTLTNTHHFCQIYDLLAYEFLIWINHQLFQSNETISPHSLQERNGHLDKNLSNPT